MSRGKYHDFFNHVKKCSLISKTEFARHIEQYMSNCRLWEISTPLRDIFIKIVVLILKNEPWQDLEKEFLQQITLPLLLDEMLSDTSKAYFHHKVDPEIQYIAYRKCQRQKTRTIQDFMQDTVHLTKLTQSRFTPRHQALFEKHLSTLNQAQLDCLFWRLDELGRRFYDDSDNIVSLEPNLKFVTAVKNNKFRI